MATHSSILAWKITWTSLMAQTVKCLPIMWETQVRSLGGEDPLEKEMAPPTPVLLPVKSHGQTSPVGCSLWGHRESDRTEGLNTYSLNNCGDLLFHVSPQILLKVKQYSNLDVTNSLLRMRPS